MCLSIKVNNPLHILDEGTHLGFEWIIVHNGMGYRCGYVRVPKGHPWHGKDYNEINVDVHGGLTFGEHDVPCDKGGPDDAFWFGFDCAHCDDAPDPELLTKYRSARQTGVVRTQAYVEDQCHHLCKRALEATKETSCPSQ
jgi:hypothetical protein